MSVRGEDVLSTAYQSLHFWCPSIDPLELQVLTLRRLLIPPPIIIHLATPLYQTFDNSALVWKEIDPTPTLIPPQITTLVFLLPTRISTSRAATSPRIIESAAAFIDLEMLSHPRSFGIIVPPPPRSQDVILVTSCRVMDSWLLRDTWSRIFCRGFRGFHRR